MGKDPEWWAVEPYRPATLEGLAAEVDEWVTRPQPEIPGHRTRPEAPWRAPVLASIGHVMADEVIGNVDCLLRGVESPIEELLGLAMCRWAAAMGVGVKGPVNGGIVFWPRPTMGPGPWLTITPQSKVLEWRADFAVGLEWDNGVVGKASVLVECDGHDFHERTKEQAARDKKRDRSLALAGWTVLRFAGSEIHKDPPGCAGGIADFLWARIKEGK